MTASSQAKRERKTGSSQPISTTDKISGSKTLSFRSTRNHSIPSPRHPIRSTRTCTRILILTVIQSIKCKVPTPREPSRRIYHITYRRLHHDRSRIFSPRPPEVRRKASLDRAKVRGGTYS
ncbi:hypothetical protein Hanom_Chr02g00119051 [Helianthus anomalus]